MNPAGLRLAPRSRSMYTYWCGRLVSISGFAGARPGSSRCFTNGATSTTAECGLWKTARKSNAPLNSCGERHEEPESGTQVGAEDQVRAAAEDGEGDERDENATDLRLPADRQKCNHHRLRTYSTICLTCSSVSRLPKPGIRPVPCDCLP